MKTNYYVDGYNLFYGCLKNSPYKWLDLVYLLNKKILEAQSPKSKINKIKFFTANIRAKLATYDDLAEKSQRDYIRTMKQLYPETIEVIKGYYSSPKKEWMLTYVKPPSKQNRTAVWRVEEKQTDVNIAIEAYRDAAKGLVEQQIFVSNDSDLETALKAIREDFNKIQIGLIMPVLFDKERGEFPPITNKRLSKHAHWTRKYITATELSQSQLPEKIPTKKKPILKPSYW